MTITEAKREYNQLLNRYRNACEYFEKSDVSQEEKEKYLPNYIEILKRLNYLLGKIGVYNNDEVLYGFKI